MKKRVSEDHPKSHKRRATTSGPLPAHANGADQQSTLRELLLTLWQSFIIIAYVLLVAGTGGERINCWLSYYWRGEPFYAGHRWTPRVIVLLALGFANYLRSTTMAPRPDQLNKLNRDDFSAACFVKGLWVLAVGVGGAAATAAFDGGDWLGVVLFSIGFLVRIYLKFRRRVVSGAVDPADASVLNRSSASGLGELLMFAGWSIVARSWLLVALASGLGASFAYLALSAYVEAQYGAAELDRFDERLAAFAETLRPHNPSVPAPPRAGVSPHLGLPSPLPDSSVDADDLVRHGHNGGDTTTPAQFADDDRHQNLPAAPPSNRAAVVAGRKKSKKHGGNETKKTR